MPFEPTILTPNPTVRQPILAVLEAALAAVDPRRAVENVLQRNGDLLTIGDRHYDLARYRRIFVLGAGKAGAPMSQAVEAILGERITAGIVVVKYGHAAATQRITVVEAGHPMPDAAGVEAGRRLLETTDHTVAAVARAVGLRHAETFHRAFTRRVGTTPARYRQHFAHQPSARQPTA